MASTSLRRLRPKADDVFLFEKEDLVTCLSSSIKEASFTECIEAVDLLSGILMLKFKEYVKTIPNCRSVVYDGTSRSFAIKTDGFKKDTSHFRTIDPYWFFHTKYTMEICRKAGMDATFTPRSAREAIKYFSDLGSSDENLRRDMWECSPIGVSNTYVRLTPETAVRYLSRPGVEGYLNPRCGAIWGTLSAGLSIQQSHNFATMAHKAYEARGNTSITDWEYRRRTTP